MSCICKKKFKFLGITKNNKLEEAEEFFSIQNVRTECKAHIWINNFIHPNIQIQLSHCARALYFK